MEESKVQKTISAFLLRSKDIKRASVIYNIISASLTSFLTMVLLLLLTRKGTPEHSAFFVMACTAANLLMHIGKYGMRQYQVTDVTEKYSFRAYVASRFFSVSLMGASLCLFLLWSVLANGYSAEKAAVVALVTLFRGVEAAEDVLHGRMQQQGRLDVASKILAFRNAVFILGFAVVYLLTKNLVLTCAVNGLLTLFLAVLLNRSVLPVFRDNAPSAEPASRRIPWRLLWECLPLCLTMVTYMYLGNAPKYIVDGLVSDAVQTRFNIVIMPAFVVSLFCTFVFNPILKRIGDIWTSGDTAALRRLVRRLVLVPVAIDALMLLGGYFLGLPVLGFVYKVDLDGYLSPLMAFLLSSGAVAMLNLFVALLTSMRKQQHLLYAYASASLLLLAFGRKFFLAYGLNALCWAYLAVLLGVLAYCILIYFRTVRRHTAAARQ